MPVSAESFTTETIAEGVEALANEALGGRKWYQYVDFGNGQTTEPYSGGRAKHRTESFVGFLESFDIRSDDAVIDIGCNAGLFTLIAAQRCADAIGVEIDRAFCAQAEFLKTYYESLGKRVDNVHFYCTDLMQRLELLSDRTAVIASKVLYHKHLGDGLYRLMEAIRRAPIRHILLQGHTTQGTMGKDDGMRQLMADYGFDYRIVEAVDEYPIALASR